MNVQFQECHVRRICLLARNTYNKLIFEERCLAKYECNITRITSSVMVELNFVVVHFSYLSISASKSGGNGTSILLLASVCSLICSGVITSGALSI